MTPLCQGRTRLIACSGARRLGSLNRSVARDATPGIGIVIGSASENEVLEGLPHRRVPHINLKIACARMCSRIACEGPHDREDTEIAKQ